MAAFDPEGKVFSTEEPGLDLIPNNSLKCRGRSVAALDPEGKTFGAENPSRIPKTFEVL